MDDLTVEEVDIMFTWPLDPDGSEPLVDEVWVDDDAPCIEWTSDTAA